MVVNSTYSHWESVNDNRGPGNVPFAPSLQLIFGFEFPPSKIALTHYLALQCTACWIESSLISFSLVFVSYSRPFFKFYGPQVGCVAPKALPPAPPLAASTSIPRPSNNNNNKTQIVQCVIRNYSLAWVKVSVVQVEEKKLQKPQLLRE